MQHLLKHSNSNSNISNTANDFLNNNSTRSNSNDYVTRTEMSHLIMTIVQHYEKRISQLEHTLQTVINELQQQQQQYQQQQQQQQQFSTQDQQQHVLQPNNNHINQAKNVNAFVSNNKNIFDHQFVRTSQNDALSTQNSESSLANPCTILTAQMRKSQPFLEINQNNIQFINQLSMQLKMQNGMGYEKSQVAKSQQFNTSNKLKLNQSQQENVLSATTNFQNYVIQDDNVLGQQKVRPSSQTNVQNSACTNKTSAKYQNFSEIKNKISIFNMQHFQSPSEATSYQQMQQSPDRNTNIQSEFAKEYETSPGSLIDSALDSRFAFNKGDKAHSGTKTYSHQAISISTQDQQISNLLSPNHDIPQTVQNAKKPQFKSQFQKQIKSTEKKSGSGNQDYIHQNVSLSILLEEDSNSQQLINPLIGKTQGTLTYDGRQQVQDQRFSLGVLSQKSNQNNNHQMSTNSQNLIIKPVLDKSQAQQRSTTSLNSKVSVKTQQNFHTLQNSNPTLNAQKSQAYNTKQNTNHCMIQRHQAQKQSLLQNKDKVDIQKQLNPLQSQQSFNASQNKSSNGQSKERRDQTNKTLKTQQINIMVRKQVNNKQSINNAVKHQSNKNHDSNQQSMAKLIMPSLTQDRLFKIKTPLGVARSKTPLQMSEHCKRNNIPNHAIHLNDQSKSQLQSYKKNFESLQLDLPLMNKEDLLGQSKTFDQTKEPLTMRDLQIIEQNQFKLIAKNGSIDGCLTYSSSQTFDNNTQRNLVRSSASFNHSKKNSQNSSIIVQSSRGSNHNLINQNLDTNAQSSIVQSGSMTSRDKTQPQLNQIQLIDSSSQSSNVKKRQTTVSRLHGPRAETRLNNLVQTIQKYKDEQVIRKDSSCSQTRETQKNQQQSLVNLYNNFESKREEELRSIEKNYQVSRDYSKSNSQNTSNSQIAKSQRALNNDNKIDLNEEIQLDTLELTQGIIQLSNVTVVQNQSDNTLLSQKDCGELYDIATTATIANVIAIGKHLKKDSQASVASGSSSQAKSRNYQNYQEYFSFSNLEKEIQNEQQQQQKQQQLNSNKSSKRSLVEYHNSNSSNENSGINSIQDSHRSKNNYDNIGQAKSEESSLLIDGCSDAFEKEFENVYVSADLTKRMERSDTMIKLCVNNNTTNNIQLETYKSDTTFEHLTGDILDIISEYLPNHDQNIPPLFTLSNSKILNNYAKYKKENYSIQNEILVDQIAELKKELFDYFDQKLFKMSKGLSIIYYSNINSKEWTTLEELCRDKILNQDDLTLLRVYLLLLGTKPKSQNHELQDQLYQMIYDHKNRLNQIFNPELHFTFGPQILCQVGSLLQTFSLENYIINYNKSQSSQSRKIRTLQILAQIIYEALQFCKIVPNRIESDIRELERVIDLYTNHQDKLEKLTQIKYSNI